MFTGIVKKVGCWFIEKYTGTLAGVAMDMAAGRIKDDMKLQSICNWTAEAAECLGGFANALKDGKVTPEERIQVVALFEKLSIRLSDIIKD